MLSWDQLVMGMGFSVFKWPEKTAIHQIWMGLAGLVGRDWWSHESTKQFIYKLCPIFNCHIMDQICECKNDASTIVAYI
jgi:hypothetical protein